ncbi:MAG: hypothetical protein COV76_06315 [Candidatus Omnitrophica bacterium CG11_big_fil_rev_8_21_14_0_20_64_10]|nr:MAG: hypothetical protein COV76_06315 [Candidatus Omnitrophica bacterium CG11_big_fil_rev_8_21_14_0_20_64_10]
MPGSVILLVEDESDALYASQTALQSRGHKVYAANSGEMAFRYIKSVRPRLMVVDYRLPGMTGAKLIRDAARMDPGLKAIVLTGQTHMFSAVEKECRALGVTTILRKPVTIAELNRAVDQILNPVAGRPSGSPVPHA